MRITCLFGGLAGTLFLASSAHAADKPQIISVVVSDQAGVPIPNAWVRVPETEGRRIVDAETGRWEASMLYSYDGTPVVFVRGMMVDLTVSAPGYQPRRLLYEVEPRGNELLISLEVMPEREVVDTTVADEELVIDWFSK
jgi:hypothetical protein